MDVVLIFEFVALGCVIGFLAGLLGIGGTMVMVPFLTIIFTHEQASFPRVDRIWEISGGSLHDRGRLPSAIGRWDHAPAVVKNLIARGNVPKNISQADLLEAACRT